MKITIGNRVVAGMPVARLDFCILSCLLHYSVTNVNNHLYSETFVILYRICQTSDWLTSLTLFSDWLKLRNPDKVCDRPRLNFVIRFL